MTNFLRLLGGLWVAVRISLISVGISIFLGLMAGILMTSKNRILKALFRVYLEIVEESRNPKAFFEKPETERARKFLHSFEYEN